MGLALGIFLVGIDKRLKGLNEKRILKKSSSHSSLSYHFRFLLFRCKMAVLVGEERYWQKNKGCERLLTY